MQVHSDVPVQRVMDWAGPWDILEIKGIFIYVDIKPGTGEFKNK